MISILMAAYNGEKYIAGQIESLLSQTFQSFRLFICDDCSTDSTYSIITEYAAEYPEKIFVSQNKANSGNPKHNFIKLIIEHKDDYIMLCDQDDVWLSDKIEKSLNKIQQMEVSFGASTPLIVHSDLKIVDASLNVISESYEESMHSDFSRTSLNTMVVQDTFAGCSAIYNRALADLICTVPEYMVMHDWWLALVASAFGKIGTVYEPLALYRQHESNDIGARKVKSLRHIFHMASHYNKMAETIGRTYLQASSFLKQYGSKLTDAQREFLTEYALLPTFSVIRRFQTLVKYKSFKIGFARKAAQLFVVLKERRAFN